MQTTIKASTPSITDAKLVTTKSAGDRSLTTSSMITPEDEVLSLRVRSLYDSSTAKDSSIHVFTEPSQRRVSSVIEEGSVLLAQQYHAGIDKSDTKSAKGNTLESTQCLHLTKITVDCCSTSHEQRPLSDITKDEIGGSVTADGIEDWENLEGQEVDRYV